MTTPKLFIALDTPDLDQALSLAKQLDAPEVGLKIGLEFLSAHGPQGAAKMIETGRPVFIDCKLHDIPNTVAGAIRALTRLRPYMLNVHAAGGPAMMTAAKEAVMDEAAQGGFTAPKLLAVTLLTSINEEDAFSIGTCFCRRKLKDLGFTVPEGEEMRPHIVRGQVHRLATLAKESGLDGIVCAPTDINIVRQACGDDFQLLTPGIRPKGAEKGDQKRTLTPKEALDLGSNYLVIGRPITQAKDPALALRNILGTLS